MFVVLRVVAATASLLCFTTSTIYAQPIPEPSLSQKPNFIQRSINYTYRIIEGDSAHPRKRLIVVLPIIAYKPETRWLFGASITQIFRLANDSITRPSYIRLNISYSQNRQFSTLPMFDVFTKNNKWNIRGSYNYTNFGEFYYGIGYKTPQTNEEFYTFDMHDANVKVAYRFLPNLYAGIQYNFEQMYNVVQQPGGLLEQSKINGYDGYRASGLGLTLYYDSRDHVYFPHRGSLVEISNVFHERYLGSEYKFVNIMLDARTYIHLWKDNVLALQGTMNFNEGQIPFRMMGVMGSYTIMRGYYNGRYRDNHSMAFQAELRKTIWGPVGIVAFGGGGTVSGTELGLFNHIQPNYGVGLRLKAVPKERVNARIDLGMGSKGTRAVYITLNEAF